MSVPILTGGRQKGDEAVARPSSSRRGCSRSRSRSWRRSTRGRRGRSWSPRARRGKRPPGTVQQAQRAYQIADVRFTNGVSTQLELSDARLPLQQAEANRALAARDLQVARARVALLPNLPVGTRCRRPAWHRRACRSRRRRRRAPAAPQGGGQIQERVRARQRSHRQGFNEDHGTSLAVMRSVHLASCSCITRDSLQSAKRRRRRSPRRVAVQIGAENVVPVTTGHDRRRPDHLRRAEARARSDRSRRARRLDARSGRR